MREPILQVRGLHYAYDEEKHALDNISMDIHPGERIAVLGTNGAGKSTFFLCLNGVLEPHEGEIFLHGQQVDKRARNILREHVGVVFQNADDQIIASTVLAEVSFGPMNLRLPRRRWSGVSTSPLRPWIWRIIGIGRRTTCPAAKKNV